MSNNINLVTGKTFDLEKQLKRIRILRITAIASLAIVSLISIALFIITVTLPISSVKKDQEQTVANIALLHKKLVTYSLINERIKNISGIISARKNYGKTSDIILSKLSPDLTIDSLAIEKNTLTIGISGQSLITINKFIDDILDLSNGGKTIKNLVVQSLLLNSGNEKFTLNMQADTL